jgi:magnesium transporter
MLFRYEHQGVEWVDLENPSVDELRDVARELGFGGRILEELISPSPLPTVLYEASATLLVLHFPSARILDGRPAEQEVDFVIAPHFVLTVRYEVVATIHELRKFLETNALVGHTKEKISADALLEVILNRLYEQIRLEIAQSSKHLEHVGGQLFGNSHKEMSNLVRTISEINRELLHVEAGLGRHADALELFLTELTRNELFGALFVVRARRITSQHKQTTRAVVTLRQVAIELRETNVSLLNATQNEIMKTLTILAFITFPLSLVTTIFGMDTDHSPILGMANDFWIIIGGMVALAACFLTYFKYKRWM